MAGTLSGRLGEVSPEKDFEASKKAKALKH